MCFGVQSPCEVRFLFNALSGGPDRQDLVVPVQNGHRAPQSLDQYLRDVARPSAGQHHMSQCFVHGRSPFHGDDLGIDGPVGARESKVGSRGRLCAVR